MIMVVTILIGLIILDREYQPHTGRCMAEDV